MRPKIFASKLLYFSSTLLIYVLLFQSQTATATLQASFQDITHERNVDTKSYHVQLGNQEGLVEHKLHLKKRSLDESVLHEAVSVISAEADETGKIHFDKWTPSKEELDKAEDIHFDHNQGAVLRINKEENGKETFSGVFNGYAVNHDGVNQVAKKMDSSHSDYIRRTDYSTVPRQNLSTFASTNQGEENIAELLIFVDKEWADSFGQNRQKILEYWTVFMWDVNMRFKTLAGASVRFRVTAVVIASSTAAQPFIEQSRAADGRTNLNRILDKFTAWLGGQRQNLPKFDLAVAVTKSNGEWCCGLAFLGSICESWNTLTWYDDGGWGMVNVGTHELGHSFGSPHDGDGDCKNDPYEGFIMGGSNQNNRYFFSPCSVRVMNNYLNSGRPHCLRTRNEPGASALPEEFENPLASYMHVQCRQRARDNSMMVDSASFFNCKTIKCYNPNTGYNFMMEPLENTECGDPGSRCFRGRCRKPGHMIKNVGNGLCIRALDQFAFSAGYEVVGCKRVATALDRLVMEDKQTGLTLASPYTIGGQTKESGDKCMYAGSSDAEVIGVWSDRCGDYKNPWHGWQMKDTGNSQFLIVHKVTGRCLVPSCSTSGCSVSAQKNCNTNNNNIKWSRYF